MLYRGLSVITASRGDTLVASPDPYIHTNYGSTYANGHAFSWDLITKPWKMDMIFAFNWNNNEYCVLQIISFYGCIEILV